MTAQQVQEVPVFIEDPAVLAEIKWAVDELDTTEATQYAIARDVSPPNDTPGWMLCQRFESDGSEGPLVWIFVSESGEED